MVAQVAMARWLGSANWPPCSSSKFFFNIIIFFPFFRKTKKWVTATTSVWVWDGALLHLMEFHEFRFSHYFFLLTIQLCDGCHSCVSTLYRSSDCNPTTHFSKLRSKWDRGAELRRAATLNAHVSSGTSRHRALSTLPGDSKGRNGGPSTPEDGLEDFYRMHKARQKVRGDFGSLQMGFFFFWKNNIS